MPLSEQHPLMDNDFGRKDRSSRDNLMMVTDIGRALVILSVAVVLLLGDFFKFQQIMQIYPLLRYMFGGISLMYGSFRLYRGIKRDY